MGQMNVDPQKVEELIKRLHAHTQNTLSAQKQLKGYLTQMQQYWNDAHYKGFVEQFNEFDKSILKSIQLSETVLLPNLKNVKKFAEEYKNMGKK